MATMSCKRKQLLKHSYMVFQDVNTQLFTESVDQEMKLLNQDIEETHVNAILKHMNLLAKKRRIHAHCLVVKSNVLQ